MGLFFQNRLGQSAGLGNPANQFFFLKKEPHDLQDTKSFERY